MRYCSTRIFATISEDHDLSVGDASRQAHRLGAANRVASAWGNRAPAGTSVDHQEMNKSAAPELQASNQSDLLSDRLDDFDTPVTWIHLLSSPNHASSLQLADIPPHRLEIAF